MSNFAQLPASGTSASGPLLSTAAHIVRGIALRLQSSRARRELQEAPEYLLRDLGLCESPRSIATEYRRRQSDALFGPLRFE